VNQNTKKNIVVLSPFLLIAVNLIVAITFGKILGKWAFIPIILIEWCLFMFLVLRFGGADSIKKWLKKPAGNFGWTILAVVTGLIPLPLFLLHYDLLSPWKIWLPWILLALVNPWVEEFYWRGLLLEYTSSWNRWTAIFFTSIVFAGNHAVFGLNSELLSGWEVLISTFIMGFIWAVVFKKTNCLRWVIFAHFLVDLFSLSAPSFLDLYKPGW
jgi:membrane protease YdiL (CAAX protease family)